MKILAFDCSAGPASCAVTDGKKLCGQFFINVPVTHSQTLMPMAEALLQSVQLSLEDIDGFAISNGPGSFTGVRIGVGAVKGLAEPKRKKCVGVSTLEAIARIHTGKKIICAVMDARCSQVYNALFFAEGCKRLCDDRALMIDELVPELIALHEEYKGYEIVLAGDGARLVYDTAKLDFLTVAPAPVDCQTAYGVALVAAEVFENGGGVDPEQLMPYYLRLPQAERELKNKSEGGKQQ